MKYQSPEINVPGDAARLIRLAQIKGSGQLEVRDPSFPVNPAYDLDE